MLKALFNFFFPASFLSNFKSYRKKKGGTWYYTYDDSFSGGFESPVRSWVREKPSDSSIEILETESY